MNLAMLDREQLEDILLDPPREEVQPLQCSDCITLDCLPPGATERNTRIRHALAAIGIPGVYEGALCFVTNPSLISRAHFARYLVSIGIARDVPGVFQHYLTPGKPGYVDHRWATLEEAVGWITGAGGAAVVAHPARYKMSGADMRRFLDDFKDVGGRGIEVTCGSHSPDHVMHFARLARHYEFHASPCRPTPVTPLAAISATRRRWIASARFARWMSAII